MVSPSGFMSQLQTTLKSSLATRICNTWELHDKCSKHPLTQQLTLTHVNELNPAVRYISLVTTQSTNKVEIIVNVSILAISRCFTTPSISLPSTRLVNVFVDSLASFTRDNNHPTHAQLKQLMINIKKQLVINIDDADELNILRYNKSRFQPDLNMKVLGVVTFNHDGVVNDAVGSRQDNVFFKLKERAYGQFIYDPQHSWLLRLGPGGNVVHPNNRRIPVITRFLNKVCRDFVVSSESSDSTPFFNKSATNNTTPNIDELHGAFKNAAQHDTTLVVKTKQLKHSRQLLLKRTNGGEVLISQQQWHHNVIIRLRGKVNDGRTTALSEAMCFHSFMLNTQLFLSLCTKWTTAAYSCCEYAKINSAMFMTLLQQLSAPIFNGHWFGFVVGESNMGEVTDCKFISHAHRYGFRFKQTKNTTNIMMFNISSAFFDGRMTRQRTTSMYVNTDTGKLSIYHLGCTQPVFAREAFNVVKETLHGRGIHIEITPSSYETNNDDSKTT